MAKKKGEDEISSEGFIEEFCTKPYTDADGVQVTSGIGKDGQEYPDPVPMAPPVGYDAPPDLMTMMHNMLRSQEVQRRLDAEGFDTMEEAGDLDIADDPDLPLTIHEAILMPLPKEDGNGVAANKGGNAPGGDVPRKDDSVGKEQPTADKDAPDGGSGSKTGEPVGGAKV